MVILVEENSSSQMSQA